MAEPDQPNNSRTLLAGGVGASILSSLGAGSYLFQFIDARDGGRLACTCVEARDCVAGYSVGVVSCFAAAGLVKTMAGVYRQEGAVDGLGPAARFDGANGVAVNAAGTVYIADLYNHTIRQMGPDGRMSTFAGRAGQPGYVDGLGAAARFYRPFALAVDADGIVYVACLDHTIRRIDSAGSVTTLAGMAGQKGTVDGVGGQYRRRLDGTLLHAVYIYGIAVDRYDNICVTDFGNHTVRPIKPTGVVFTLAWCPP